MSEAQRGLTGGDLFVLWIHFVGILVVLGLLHSEHNDRFDALDAACGVEQVEEG